MYPTICYPQKALFRSKDTNRLKVEEIFHTNDNQKIATKISHNRLETKHSYMRQRRTSYIEKSDTSTGKCNNDKHKCTQHKSSNVLSSPLRLLWKARTPSALLIALLQYQALYLTHIYLLNSFALSPAGSHGERRWFRCQKCNYN